MPCLSFETLEAYWTEALEDAARELARLHLAECADCRVRLDVLRDSLELVRDVRAHLGATPPSPRPAETPSVTERVLERFGVAADPRIVLAPGGEPEPPSPTLRRLNERDDAFRRYRLQGEVARGGMARILRVWDEDLRRQLALKVLPGSALDTENSESASTSQGIRRFLEEAQVTAQLDHPAVVPVHELGLDDQERLYFTMKLVEGRTLKEVIESVQAGDEEWTLFRAVGVVHRVCEAMAYAHDKGVLHRDLKPTNVMVGSFGAVYVMDWGLARVLGREDPRDLRPETIHIERESLDDSPLLTRDGHVIGTPAYMPPEQARGDLERIDQRTDVYAVGAMLYHLLTGHVPYVAPGTAVSATTIHFLVLSGPPRPVIELAPDVPAELVAICEKAMAREPEQRFQSMEELAENLRAYLEGRVVRAFETGAWAELRKWVRRNRSLAAAIVAAVTLAIGGLASTNYIQARATDRILRLSAVETLRQLEIDRARLWPTHPEHVTEYERALAEARQLVAELPRFEATLEELSAKALPSDDEARRRAAAAHPLAGELAWKRRRAEKLSGWLAADPGAPPWPAELLAELETEIPLLEAEVQRRQTYTIESPHIAWQHELYAQLVIGVRALEQPETGLIADFEARLVLARKIAEQSVYGPEAGPRWSEAIASIADPGECPAYGGLTIQPQMGLLPIGRDSWSGLWEFAHLLSGTQPERNDERDLVITDESAIVLVLLPGGDFQMGAQGRDPDQPNFHQGWMTHDGPVHTQHVEPYLLSKYAMTQAQWNRCRGSNPSKYSPKLKTTFRITLSHPVETVTWHDSVETLTRLGLRLPRESEWEYAARAGTTTAWWFGVDIEDFRYTANAGSQDIGNMLTENWAQEPWEDGFALHAPVDTFAPNPFGLYQIYGNVWEWCADRYDLYHPGVFQGMLEALPNSEGRLRIRRGGAFTSRANDCTSASRDSMSADFGRYDVGVRPACSLEP